MTKVINELKQMQADALVMYTKLHNYHWNIKGLQFFPIHEMTEKMYDNFSELYDESAELILQREEKPLVSMADIMGTSRINEEKQDKFDAKCVLDKILADFETFKSSFKTLSTVAEEANDTTIVAFADDNIAKLEKDIWMIKASLG